MGISKTWFFGLVLLSLLVVSASAQADGPRREGMSPRNAAFIEHHGYLWSANTLFHDGWDAGAPSKGTFGSVLRLDYRPIVHVSDVFRLRLGMRVLEDTVYGSKPQFDVRGGSSPAETQDAGVDLSKLLDDAFLMRYMVGDWEPFPGIRVSLGRMPVSYGLGMFDNDGLCLDCGTNSNRDGVEVSTNLFGLGLSMGWHWISEGPTSQNSAVSVGQALDLGQADDGGSWFWQLSPEFRNTFEEQKRVEQAKTNSSWLFDWSVRIRRRTAQLQSDHPPEGAVCAESNVGNNPDTSYDCLALSPRHSDIWSPGVFLQLRTWTQSGHKLSLSAEFMTSLGTIEVTQGFDEPSSDRNVVQYGGALDINYQVRRWTFALKAGLASGDPDGRFLGVRDGSNTVAVPDSAYFLSDSYASNTTFQQFHFSRDYFVDLLLFREVIGAVTNATYVRPSIARSFGAGDHNFSVELSGISGWAMTPDSTPGKAGFYGVEVDLLTAYRFQDRFLMELKGGLLSPGDALNGLTGQEMGPTWTTQVDFFVLF